MSRTIEGRMLRPRKEDCSKVRDLVQVTDSSKNCFATTASVSRYVVDVVAQRVDIHSTVRCEGLGFAITEFLVSSPRRVARDLRKSRYRSDQSYKMQCL